MARDDPKLGVAPSPESVKTASCFAEWSAESSAEDPSTSLCSLYLDSDGNTSDGFVPLVFGSNERIGVVLDNKPHENAKEHVKWAALEWQNFVFQSLKMLRNVLFHCAWTIRAKDNCAAMRALIISIVSAGEIEGSLVIICF